MHGIVGMKGNEKSCSCRSTPFFNMQRLTDMYAGTPVICTQWKKRADRRNHENGKRSSMKNESGVPLRTCIYRLLIVKHAEVSVSSFGSKKE